jgi:hypothetical protein
VDEIGFCGHGQSVPVVPEPAGFGLAILGLGCGTVRGLRNRSARGNES